MSDFFEKQAAKFIAAKEQAEKLVEPIVEIKQPTIEIKEPVKEIVEEKKDEVKIEIPQEIQERIDLDKNKSQEEVVVEDPDIKSHLDWLKEEEQEIEEKSDKANINYEEELKTYKTKLQEYESLMNDDYVKAIVDFRKAGGTDLNELSNKLGIVDPNKVTIEDFYSEKGKAQGLNGEDLKEAVEEAVDRYKSLPKLDQAQILNDFKNTLKAKTEEKLKSFSVQNQSQLQEQERIKNAFFTELNKEVSDKIGKKFRGLLIDEKMSKEIAEAAPSYSVAKFDGKGNFIGYDAKKGVELAIFDKFGKKLLKAQYDLASKASYDKVIQERNRPNENMTSNQVVTTTTNTIAEISKRRREEAELEKKRRSGRA